MRDVHSEAKTPISAHQPKSSEEIHEFEQNHGVQLPDCYRVFLVDIGEDGVGPAFKYFTLSQWNYAYEDFPQTLPQTLSWSCSLNEDSVWLYDDVEYEFLYKGLSL